MKKILQLTLILTVVFSFTAISKAQEQKEISAEKERLISELVVLTKTNEQIVEFTDQMLEGMNDLYPVIIEQTLARDKDLTVSEKENLKEYMVGKFDSFNKKFRKRLPEEIDYPKFVRQVFYPLYDKYFTADELRDLIAFYRTATGQKVVTTMPKLLEESQAKTQEVLVPQVLTLLDKILKEEIGDPAKNKDSSPPPPPPPAIDGE